MNWAADVKAAPASAALILLIAYPLPLTTKAVTACGRIWLP